jgi:hypothetical protein
MEQDARGPGWIHQKHHPPPHSLEVVRLALHRPDTAVREKDPAEGFGAELGVGKPEVVVLVVVLGVSVGITRRRGDGATGREYDCATKRQRATTRQRDDKTTPSYGSR